MHRDRSAQQPWLVRHGEKCHSCSIYYDKHRQHFVKFVLSNVISVRRHSTDISMNCANRIWSLEGVKFSLLHWHFKNESNKTVRVWAAVGGGGKVGFWKYFKSFFLCRRLSGRPQPECDEPDSSLGWRLCGVYLQNEKNKLRYCNTRDHLLDGFEQGPVLKIKSHVPGTRAILMQVKLLLTYGLRAWDWE